MKIELFYAPGCNKCAANREGLKRAAEETGIAVEWIELDVLENMDYAVELGILTLPAIAIDGILKFPALPNAKQLVDVINRTSAVTEGS